MRDALALLIGDAVKDVVVDVVVRVAVCAERVYGEKEEGGLGVELLTCYGYSEEVSDGVVVAGHVLAIVFDRILEAVWGL